MGRDARCGYRFDSGTFCEESVERSSGSCFFHDPKIKKNTPEARERLLEAVKAKKYLEGAYLEKADLSKTDLGGVWLIKAHLAGANLERANLERAHLYGADFQGADLFNANLQCANLKECNMGEANILEIKIDGAKILGIRWGRGKRVLNEEEGLRLERAGEGKRAGEKFLEAEEIYRNLRTHLMSAGIFEEAGDFFYREMVVHRKQMPLCSIQRLSSKIIDVICGYGEKTFRVVTVALSFVFLNSFAYFIFGIRYGQEILRYDPAQSLTQNVHEYLLTVYFSMVTFTTLGYGDIAPLGFSRVFTMLEAFLGAFMIALFVLVFARKMIR